MIPYGRQDISAADIDAVVSVLKSDFLTQGPVVPLFEDEVKNFCGASHSVAVNSATSALHIACLALDLGPGDIMWTSPISFVASSNSALYCGATVDFVDIDFNTNNMSIEALKAKLQKAKKAGSLPKVVMPVHMGGRSCCMEDIYQLSKEFNFRIIEDASHAIGGKYLGKPVGSCQFSDITVFSFHPVKIITTGEGGVALTNDKTLYERMNILRSHGVTRNKEIMTRANEGDWYYEQIDLGLNYRMTEMQAALGLSQMSRLDTFVEERNKLALSYHDRLSDLVISLPYETLGIYSSYHLYIVKLHSKSPAQRKTVFEFMRANDVAVNVHYIPIHLQPYYGNMGFHRGQFPEAELYYDGALSLPLYPGLTEALVDKISALLSESLMLDY